MGSIVFYDISEVIDFEMALLGKNLRELSEKK